MEKFILILFLVPFVCSCQCDIQIAQCDIDESTAVVYNTDIQPINKTSFYIYDGLNIRTYTNNFVSPNVNNQQPNNEWVVSNPFSVENCEDIETFTVLEANASNSSSVKVLKIGDSLTDPYVSISRIVSNFSSDVMNVDFIGTQDAAPFQNEGYGGKTFSWHNSNVSSPFVFSSQFDFSMYLSSNSLTMGSGDWVIFQLGTNDIFPGNDCINDYNSAKVNLDNMIADIQATVPGIRIAVCTIHNTNSNDDAWIDNYNNVSYNETFHSCAVEWNDNLMSDYPIGLNDVFIIPIHYALDNASDFPALNAVHPSTSGYNKIGDYITAFLKYYN